MEGREKAINRTIESNRVNVCDIAYRIKCKRVTRKKDGERI